MRPLSPTFRWTPAVCALLLVGPAFGFARLSSDEEEPVRVRIAAVAIVTEQFPEMLTFYRDVVGFRLKDLDERSDFAEFHSEGVRFQLMTPATMRDASGLEDYEARDHGHSFELAFEVERPELVDTLFERVVAHGAEPIAPPVDKPWGQRIAFFADPDGNVHDIFAAQ